jgi:hypothetical protein
MIGSFNELEPSDIAGEVDRKFSSSTGIIHVVPRRRNSISPSFAERPAKTD